MRTSARLAQAQRVVVKVGSSSITGANESNLDQLVDFLVRLQRAGKSAQDQATFLRGWPVAVGALL